MVYVAMMCITQMGFSHRNSDEGVNSIAEIHSDDSDAFAGISMQVILSIESFYINHGKKFTGSIYLRGPRNSVSVNQITKLPNRKRVSLFGRPDISLLHPGAWQENARVKVWTTMFFAAPIIRTRTTTIPQVFVDTHKP